MPASLNELEAIVDTSGVAELIEQHMPTGGRPRQLPVRTLLVGILLAIADDRPAQLTRVHQALVALGDDDQRRLGVLTITRHGDHLLTYRQVERTFASMTATIDPTPVPSFRNIDDDHRATHLAHHRAGIDTHRLESRLTTFIDALVEASIPDTHKHTSTSVAVDWTDHATWARPASADAVAADPDASWGHRNTNTPGTKDGLFFGYYGQAVTTVADEHGPPIPELIRRVILHPCNIDPPTALVPVLQRLAASGITIGDVLADSGYAHRVADHWATPLRRLGARLVQDLHPHDRGPKGTHQGAICCNGNLYCPATPTALLQLAPLARSATNDDIAAHDTRTSEAARYKLGRLSADDADGYHRVGCPASAGKLRCPLKPTSMTLGYDHPEILHPPPGTAPCCAQTSITVPPSINAKTRQKHDYPSPAWRQSYNRRSSAERSFSTLKDPATTDIRRGWCRLLGTTKNLIVYACAAIIRNLRILASFQRRHTGHTPPRRRARRRTETAPLP
ncbi:MAG: hypothetical protein IT195_13310 [Microthrixaceae bacterium]|nr:hypothetical protein [Microthrixaceae bacterium]